MFDPQYLKDFDQFFFTRCRWTKHFSILPRRCWSSRQSLWFKRCYKATVVWTGPGDPIAEERWFSEDTALWFFLSGDNRVPQS